MGKRVQYFLSLAFWAVSSLVLGVLGCDQTAQNTLIGKPPGPYQLALRLDPAAPQAGQETHLIFRLTERTSKQPVADLQILHERALHTFIVSKNLRVFAHTHHEDFFPLTAEDLAAATFHFPHTFPQAGEYMVVSEFTHKDRSWVKHFTLQVGDAGQGMRTAEAEREPELSEFARKKSFGPYQIELRTSPDPPVVGHSVELVCVFTKDGEPVTDLGLYLGTEVHMASWRIDGEHFGHQHTYTPEMAALMNMMQDHAGHADAMNEMKARMDALMIQLMSGEPKQTYPGPELPVQHVFPTPGVYKLFFEVAPGGKRLVADFVVQVADYEEGINTTVRSIVPEGAGS